MEKKEKMGTVSTLMYSAVLTVILTLLIKKYLGASGLEHSIWDVLIFAAICMLLKKYRSIKGQLSRKKKRYLTVFCACFAMTEVLGVYLVRDGSIFAANLAGAAIEILMFIAVTAILYQAAAVLSQWKPFGGNEGLKPGGKLIFDWIIIMIGWFPVLLAYYPGIFAYDASDQVMQVMSGSYSTHHPLLHTLLLGYFFKWGNNFGSNNAGIFLYSIVQMAILAWVMAWAVDYMKKRGMNRGTYIILMAFYIFFPVNSMLAISTTKDILFSAFCLIVMIFLMKVTDTPELWKQKGLVLAGSAALAGMMLFRNNALYACILFCPLFFFLAKRFWKNYLGWIGISLVLTAVISLSMGAILRPEKGSIVVMLNVPLQQMARVGYYHADELDSDIKEELYHFVPENAVKQYGPNISDGVNKYIDDTFIKEEPFRFFRIYIKLGLNWPREYLDAFACLTQGFWYIDDTSHAYIYGVGMESRLGYMLTNYKSMPEGYEVTHMSYFPQLEYLLEKLFSDNKYLKVPILSVLFAPAFWEWMLVGYAVIVLYKRRYDMLIPVLFLIGYQLTLLLGPVCIIRYVYPVVICVPILLIKVWQLLKSDKH